MSSHLVQGSSEWLEWRKTKVGASDAPIIMDVSPWKTALQLWEEKVGIKSAPEESRAMLRGTDMEPEARKAFEDSVGIDMFPQVLTHPDYDWMIASLDGLSLDGTTAVEIKCPGKKAHDIAKSGKVPDYYYPQLQHQLAVLGLPFIYYWSYDGSEGALVKVERDGQYISTLIEHESSFVMCLKTETPPDPSFRDYVEKPEWENGLGDDIIEAKAQLEAANDRLEQLKFRAIAEANGQSCRGGGISIRKSYAKSSINYSKIPELKDVDLEAYRGKPRERWTLSIRRSTDV